MRPGGQEGPQPAAGETVGGGHHALFRGVAALTLSCARFRCVAQLRNVESDMAYAHIRACRWQHREQIRQRIDQAVEGEVTRAMQTLPPWMLRFHFVKHPSLVHQTSKT